MTPATAFLPSFELSFYNGQLLARFDPAQLPAGTTVALKNGWVPIPPTNHWQINTIGWVSGHGRDYVLAVLSADNPSEGYGIETVDHIASTIYAKLRPGG